jgi:hypothetical protein
MLTTSSRFPVLSLPGAQVESLPLDGPQQELIEFLVLWRVQEILTLVRVGDIARDQPSLGIGQGVR